MRRRDPRAAVHVPYGEDAHGPLLQRPGQRGQVPGMEGGTQGNLLRHGLNAPRPFRKPPTRRKAARSKSYRIADAILAIVTIAAASAVVLGYGAAYQVGYQAAEAYYSEVRHG